MPTLILTPVEVRKLLPMGACIDLMAEALEALAQCEDVQNPLRQGLRLPDGRILGMMPGWLGDPATFGLKVVAVMPQNHGTEFDAHQGIVMLFDPENGVPLVIMDGSEVTSIRTAAVSGLATRVLAGEGARELAILGSGVQATSHLEAMLAVRSFENVRIYSPNRPNRERFARQNAERFGIPIDPVDSARQAVEGADVVCTVTSSPVPVLEGDWLAPGTHVNAVGACIPKHRELDGSAMARGRVIVDCRESAMNESGDLLLAIEEGALSGEGIDGELGDVLLGRVAGRTSEEEITIFESLGVAVEDLVAARYVHQRAVESGVGVAVALGGGRP